MNAIQKREPNPATCNACMALLGVCVTTIAEAAMNFITLFTTCIINNTTICGVRDLCVMKTCCLLDLLLDDSKCVHLSLPEILG